MSSELVSFVMSCREPTSLTEITGELEKLGKHGAEWPQASAEHWRRDLLALVAKGDLTIDDGGKVWVPVVGAKPRQMSLFDEV